MAVLSEERCRGRRMWVVRGCLLSSLVFGKAASVSEPIGHLCDPSHKEFTRSLMESAQGDKEEAQRKLKACMKRLWKDSDAACVEGQQCSMDGAMPYSRGACVFVEDLGKTQCWDICNTNHTACEYPDAMPNSHTFLRVVQARKGLLGDVVCPCSFEADTATAAPAALQQAAERLTRAEALTQRETLVRSRARSR
eukprot:TRINITY_DN15659_c0_g1_i1.p1 TRINITY_DN15659_c0_g1~~TRINITY_DN15659_c0_g1_i1.p1  ORF type:complete len:195 (-),score=30.24 TRINITY_DN15659_c0_g1_i1:201-785(-)